MEREKIEKVIIQTSINKDNVEKVFNGPPIDIFDAQNAVRDQTGMPSITEGRNLIILNADGDDALMTRCIAAINNQTPIATTGNATGTANATGPVSNLEKLQNMVEKILGIFGKMKDDADANKNVSALTNIMEGNHGVVETNTGPLEFKGRKKINTVYFTSRTNVYMPEFIYRKANELKKIKKENHATTEALEFTNNYLKDITKIQAIFDNILGLITAARKALGKATEEEQEQEEEEQEEEEEEEEEEEDDDEDDDEDDEKDDDDDEDDDEDDEKEKEKEKEEKAKAKAEAEAKEKTKFTFNRNNFKKKEKAKKNPDVNGLDEEDENLRGGGNDNDSLKTSIDNVINKYKSDKNAFIIDYTVCKQTINDNTTDFADFVEDIENNFFVKIVRLLTSKKKSNTYKTLEKNNDGNWVGPVNENKAMSDSELNQFLHSNIPEGNIYFLAGSKNNICIIPEKPDLQNISKLYCSIEDKKKKVAFQKYICYYLNTLKLVNIGALEYQKDVDDIITYTYSEDEKFNNTIMNVNDTNFHENMPIQEFKNNQFKTNYYVLLNHLLSTTQNNLYLESTYNADKIIKKKVNNLVESLINTLGIDGMEYVEPPLITKGENGTNQCWINAPLYAFFAHKKLRDMFYKNYGNIPGPDKDKQKNKRIKEKIKEKLDKLSDMKWDEKCYKEISDVMELTPENEWTYQDPQEVFDELIRSFTTGTDDDYSIQMRQPQDQIFVLDDDNCESGDKKCELLSIVVSTSNKPNIKNNTVKPDSNASHFYAYAKVGGDSWIKFDSGTTKTANPNEIKKEIKNKNIFGIYVQVEDPPKSGVPDVKFCSEVIREKGYKQIGQIGIGTGERNGELVVCETHIEKKKNTVFQNFITIDNEYIQYRYNNNKNNEPHSNPFETPIQTNNSSTTFTPFLYVYAKGDIKYPSTEKLFTYNPDPDADSDETPSPHDTYVNACFDMIFNLPFVKDWCNKRKNSTNIPVEETNDQLKMNNLTNALIDALKKKSKSVLDITFLKTNVNVLKKKVKDLENAQPKNEEKPEEAKEELKEELEKAKKELEKARKDLEEAKEDLEKAESEAKGLNQAKDEAKSEAKGLKDDLINAYTKQIEDNANALIEALKVKSKSVLDKTFHKTNIELLKKKVVDLKAESKTIGESQQIDFKEQLDTAKNELDAAKKEAKEAKKEAKEAVNEAEAKVNDANLRAEEAVKKAQEKTEEADKKAQEKTEEAVKEAVINTNVKNLMDNLIRKAKMQLRNSINSNNSVDTTKLVKIVDKIGKRTSDLNIKANDTGAHAMEIIREVSFKIDVDNYLTKQMKEYKDKKFIPNLGTLSTIIHELLTHKYNDNEQDTKKNNLKCLLEYVYVEKNTMSFATKEDKNNESKDGPTVYDKDKIKNILERKTYITENNNTTVEDLVLTKKADAINLFKIKYASLNDDNQPFLDFIGYITYLANKSKEDFMINEIKRLTSENEKLLDKQVNFDKMKADMDTEKQKLEEANQQLNEEQQIEINKLTNKLENVYKELAEKGVENIQLTKENTELLETPAIKVNFDEEKLTKLCNRIELSTNMRTELFEQWQTEKRESVEQRLNELQEKVINPAELCKDEVCLYMKEDTELVIKDDIMNNIFVIFNKYLNYLIAIPIHSDLAQQYYRKLSDFICNNPEKSFDNKYFNTIQQQLNMGEKNCEATGFYEALIQFMFVNTSDNECDGFTDVINGLQVTHYGELDSKELTKYPYRINEFLNKEGQSPYDTFLKNLGFLNQPEKNKTGYHSITHIIDFINVYKFVKEEYSKIESEERIQEIIKAFTSKMASQLEKIENNQVYIFFKQVSDAQFDEVSKYVIDHLHNIKVDNEKKDIITAISEMNSKHLMTIMKFNNFTVLNKEESINEVHKWNQARYMPYISKDNRRLLLYYNNPKDPKTKYYLNWDEKSGNRDEKSGIITELPKKEHYKLYSFGNFNQIFKNDKSNVDMANDLNSFGLLKKHLQGGGAVFVMGYGSSGAGKTISLIYKDDKINPDKSEPGVMVELINQFGSENGYESVSVNIYELYAAKNNTETRNALQNLTFNLQEKLGSDVIIQKKKEYKFQRIDKHGYMDGNKSIGQILQEEITLEKNRQIASTMNNPVSSRSHVIACVKFVKTDTNQNEPLLIIGDLAGVENDFITDDFDMLKKFHEKTKFGNEIETIEPSKLVFKNNDLFQDNNQLSCTKFLKRIQSEQSDHAYDMLNTLMLHHKIVKKDYNNEAKVNMITIELNNKTLKNLFFEYHGVDKIPKDYLNMGSLNNTNYDTEITNIKEDIEKKEQLIIEKSKEIENLKGISKEGINIHIDRVTQDIQAKEKKLYRGVYLDVHINALKQKKLDTHQQQGQFKEARDLYNNINVLNNQISSLNSDLKNIDEQKQKIPTKENEIISLQNEIKNCKTKIDNIQTQKKKNEEDSLINVQSNHVGEILYGEDSDIRTILIEKMDDTTIVNQIKQFKESENSMNSIMSAVSKYIKELIYIQTQMSERQTEGKFINIELENIRTDILNGIITKSGGYTFTNPIMHNACLSTFCASKKKCFVIETPSSYQVKDKLDSELMKIIRTEMGIHTNDEFYQKLQFTIFTVFNIRQNTDNPPAQVYIDINDIKKELEQTPDSFESIILKMDKVVVIVNNLNNETLKSSVKTIMDNIKNPQTKNVKKHVNKFIEAIDKHNAITTLGTIIFTDNMAKFNTVNTLCDIPENNSNLKFSGEKVLIDSSKYEEDEKHFGDFQNAITYNASERDSDKYDVIYFNSVRKLRKSN
jgi:hypothetical protein